jgi:predicted dehydrogenase
MVSFNRRFAPPLTRAREWMAAGKHEARHIVSRILRQDRLESGFARDTGQHQVDAFLSIYLAIRRALLDIASFRTVRGRPTTRRALKRRPV